MYVIVRLGWLAAPLFLFRLNRQKAICRVQLFYIRRCVYSLLLCMFGCWDAYTYEKERTGKRVCWSTGGERDDNDYSERERKYCLGQQQLMTDDIFTLFPTPASPKLFLSSSSSFFSGVNLGYIYDVRVSLYINGKSTLIISFVSPAAISETQWRRIARKKKEEIWIKRRRWEIFVYSLKI